MTFVYTPKLADKCKYNYPSDELKKEVSEVVTKDDFEKFYKWSKEDRSALFDIYNERLANHFADRMRHEDKEIARNYTWKKIEMALDLLLKDYYRTLILDRDTRIDGRKMDQIRDLYCEVGTVDYVHGSSLFWRWGTQVLNICTLWAPGDVQLVDDMQNDGAEKRYMHHYNFPPFSVWEARKIRWTGNREIWHGALAEKALEYMIPDKATFPYTIRLVSECMASSWSTSMASVCASTMSLMDAGVPIKAPVSGMAMGLCSRTDANGMPVEYKILTDIQWAEDFNCDMDFKVAGTPNGMTAIQLDMKVKWITTDIAMEVVRRANIARLEVMEFMLKTIDKSRDNISPNAPRIITIHVDPAKIKDVIGKWWETIDKIIAETGVKIDFEDDGTCMITSKDEAAVARTIEIINGIVLDPVVGNIYDGEVAKIESFGLFVRFANGKSGLVGSRNLPTKTGNLQTMFTIKQKLKVKLIKIDDQGRFELWLV